MANPTLDYRSVLDMHTKSKTIELELRPEVFKDLRVIFSGMYPKVRLVYHRPAASISKPEHIYVVFDRLHTRQQFCRTRKIHNPLRTVYTYNSGPNEIADYIIQAIEELLGVANEGEVMFSGQLFEQDMNEGDEEENLCEAFLEALSESSNEGGDYTQEFTGRSLSDLPPKTTLQYWAVHQLCNTESESLLVQDARAKLVQAVCTCAILSGGFRPRKIRTWVPGICPAISTPPPRTQSELQEIYLREILLNRKLVRIT